MTELEIMKELLDYARSIMVHKQAYPFAACIVKNGEIISRAYNKEVNLTGDKTTHGEMEAINIANKTLKHKQIVIMEDGYELYSTCEPCLACFDTALWANVKTFVFSVDHTDFPEYFNDHPYTISTYETDNPGAIQVSRKILHTEGIQLFSEAKKTYGW